jgi:hypothetical protein
VDVLPAMAYHPSWIATHDREWGNVTCHHCTCSDYCASSDPAALKHERPLAHPGPILHHRKIDWRCLVSAHRFTEVVGSAVLLEERAVRTNDNAIPESGSVYSAAWADARSVSHV